ncbi:MAG: SPFH/Band 7/PHB domain protein [Solobacterium sp.]|nr:SPFH/Band 7/PHB domain protein [Erysipelotrichaceae bacterium]MBQ1325146.1 SPFH/Band 7/PHB domain protein [Solobacterium sp.]MBQ1383747.1 SPFH/Band 7/PHB domain protein [Solobacterium sp.]MBQ1446909.1 SPFH/Band 7/PHB domain protein [Solobacterium sp.]MBQ6591507.1 SPFH/Band 7/PHB domain protein [Solobacterium sp.]
MQGIITAAVIVVIIVIVLINCIRIVPQESEYVVERLGKYHTTWSAGMHLKMPVIDQVRRRVLLKEQVADFAPQPVITKDNVTMQIDSVVYFKVMESKLYTYGVENPIMAMENLTATTLRNIIGDLTLDETLTSRDRINSQMLAIIDEATDAWGIRVNRVELKNIQPPTAIREAMEKQMKAEREKRAAILQAEGEKQSMILQAEGKKESAVLNAEAAKQATILAAEAEKQKEIEEATGRAEAIRKVQEAQADGIRMLKEAGADEAVIRLRSLEALQGVANGQATKIIIPSDIASLTGLIEGVKEAVK